jgi:hypothetical protein
LRQFQTLSAISPLFAQIYFTVEQSAFLSFFLFGHNSLLISSDFTKLSLNLRADTNNSHNPVDIITKPIITFLRSFSNLSSFTVAEDHVSTRLAAPVICTSVSDGQTANFSLLPAENIYEFAAKLLFLAVKWPRSISSFLQVCYCYYTLLETHIIL